MNGTLTEVAFTLPAMISLLRNFGPTGRGALQMSDEINRLPASISAKSYDESWPKEKKHDLTTESIGVRAHKLFSHALLSEHVQFTNFGVSLNYYFEHSAVEYGLLVVEWNSPNREARGLGYLPYRRRRGDVTPVEIDYWPMYRAMADRVPTNISPEGTRLMNEVMALVRESVPTIVGWDSYGAIVTTGEPALATFQAMYSSLREDFTCNVKTEQIRLTADL